MTGPLDGRTVRAVVKDPGRRRVDATRLWGAGLATALVAELAASLGVLVARGVFGIGLFPSWGRGVLSGLPTSVFIVTAGLGALLATLVLQFLVALTPAPMRVFAWIMVLLTLIGTVVPFSTGAPPAAQAATGLIDLCVGLVIFSLLSQAGDSMIRDEEPFVPSAFE
ncbi:hypothetical protein AGRA3207_003685 [Actinomadura graeca]|uniref:DoxX family protein n=1 Tax=Actinomadura graeca TaxID=2750812 RepID=A0ABX8QV86_9ACTN|nr:DUF6069 family protein [Actinomadura graeca]QXJ22648.1 hypothetical protein AGRA3207_003685 [Actinomadura graeca]